MSLPALDLTPASVSDELLATPVGRALAADAEGVDVLEIDPELADTAALCAATGIPLELSANCVIVSGKREGQERIAACLVLAHTRADVNSAVKKLLDVRKASFLPMDRATEETGMEYGGITPIGLPAEWRILMDARVAAAGRVVIGSGLRRSKIIVDGRRLAELTGAEVIEDLAREA